MAGGVYTLQGTAGGGADLFLFLPPDTFSKFLSIILFDFLWGGVLCLLIVRPHLLKFIVKYRPIIGYFLDISFV